MEKKMYEKPQTVVAEFEMNQVYLLDTSTIPEGGDGDPDANIRLDVDGIMDIQDAFEDINKSVGLSVWE